MKNKQIIASLLSKQIPTTMKKLKLYDLMYRTLQSKKSEKTIVSEILIIWKEMETFIN